MSSNKLVHDPNNTLIQQQRNCVDMSGNKKLNLHYKTMTHDDKCFVDGGLLCNYPYNDCQTETQATDEEIIGFKVKWGDYKLKVDNTTNLVTYISTFFRMMTIHIYETENILSPTANTIECISPNTGGPAKWVDVFVNPETCKEFIECGIESAISYMREKQIINIDNPDTLDNPDASHELDTSHVVQHQSQLQEQEQEKEESENYIET